MKAAIALTLGLICATAALAETQADPQSNPQSSLLAAPLSGKDARKLVITAKTAVVEVMLDAGLSAPDQTALGLVGAQQPYYGAIAISPGDGLLSEATVAAANYHDTAAAQIAALAECDAKKTTPAACVIAALIRPDGYAPRALQLSVDATTALRKDYPGKGGALAISAQTGAWGIGAGADAATAACAAKGGATDCAVVVQD